MAKSKRGTHRTKVERKVADAETGQVVDKQDFFECPESSTIASAHYNNGEMVVWFKRGPGRDNERYNYSSIPADLWERFMSAMSKGHFFSTQIRPLYAGKPDKPNA